MKNKKSMYILVPLVLIIWGLVIFKIIKGLGGGDSDDYIYHSGHMAVKDSLKVDTIISLKLNYVDPFLKYSSASVVKVKKEAESNQQMNIRRSLRQKSPIQIKKETQWPEIIYNGIIINQKSLQEVALIQIDQYSRLMKEGDTYNGISIKKLYNDSVILTYNKEKKTIYKK